MGNLRVGEPTLTTTLRGEVVCVVTMTSVAGSSNVLVPEARAKLSMRIVPGSNHSGNWTR